MRTIYIRKGNIKIMGIPEERRKREKRTFKEIITENFSNLGKEMDVYIHETGTTSNYISAEGPFPRYIILKLSKVRDKERI